MKITRKPILWIAALSIGFFQLFSCSGDVKERDASEATSAYIAENEQVVAFGHVNAIDILNKLDYKQIPQADAIISSILVQWKKGFDLSKPIYYALEAPFDHDGTPKQVVAFMTVKSGDSLKAVINEMQYSMETDGDISYYQENDITFGYRKNLFVVISQKGEYDGKAAIKEVFTQTEGDLSEGKTADILSQTGDMVAGLNVERLFLTSNTSLNELDATKKSELTSLVEDAFVQTSVHFSNGEMRIESKNLFSDALKDRLPYEDNNGNALLKKLGNNEPWFGISSNINMRKGESFIHDFVPEANEKINNKLPKMVKFSLLALGDNPFSKLFSGQFGMVASGTPNMDLSNPATMDAFIGYGPKGDIITSIMKEQLQGINNTGDTYTMNQYALTFKKDGIYAHVGNSASSGGLKIPAYAKDFGTKSFTMFMAFEKMDVKNMKLDEAAQVIGILKYMTVTADKNGTTVVITAKDKNTNILKQATTFYKQLLMEKLNS